MVFSFVVKHFSIRFLLALVAHLDLELAQHFVITFLHDDVNEKIDVIRPEGFKVASKVNWVCKL